MMVTNDRAGDEHVSDFAMDLLDELRWTLSECLLILKLLPAEADVNFGDVQQQVMSAQLNARQAYQASSLIHQRAELDERWGSGPSRPKAVFARHNAATRCGATQVRPSPAISDGFERHVWQLPALDRSQEFSGVRPNCTGLVRGTGRPCAAAAIYLGSGTFAAHCFSHATSAEREQYRTHNESVDELQRTAQQRLRTIQDSLGRAIAAAWIQRRLHRKRILDPSSRQTPATGDNADHSPPAD